MMGLSGLGLVLSTLIMPIEYQQEVSDLYFGQTPPGETPVVFAPGVISKEDRFEQFLLFSPDGRELTFSVTNSDWSMFSLFHLKMENGRWSDPVPAPFLGSIPTGLTSALSYDMKVAFFTDARPSYPPVNIWTNTRVGDAWSEPIELGPPISSEGNEFEVAISRSGTLYFSSNRRGGHGDLDVYRAKLVDGAYPSVENLGSPINTSAGDDLPYIAPDESYLIFASDRPGSLGNRDLYISFQVDGSWSEPANLGPTINTESFDSYPSMSPDGKYLFFTRREAWFATEDSDIYWVSAGFIRRLREGIDQKD